MGEDTIRRMSTGELVRRLINNASLLVDREVDLAKQEAKADIWQLVWAVAVLGFGVMLLYTFVAALIVWAVFAIAPAMTAPVAALVIAGVFLVLGVIASAIGYFMIRIKPLERTRKTVREDIGWARNQMSSSTR